MRHPLYVAFVWHMHQPSYLDHDSGELVLPWVRLHATKDYLHMVEVLEDYPDVHATFNIVPSLVEQLKGYVDGTVVDRAWRVGLKDHLSPEDKQFVDSLFFSVNKERFIRLYPRYERLQALKEQARGDLDLFSETYWRDLIVWFNLAWIDPGWLQRDPVLRALVAKGSHFTVEDVATVMDKHREAMRGVLGAYRRLQRRSQVELSVTPFFHPILPLLIDSSCATEPSPWLRLPAETYRRPEDALEQVRRAVAYHEETFGRTPSGMWPSEGAVSQELVALMASVPEIRWMATDEAILARSMGRNVDRNGWGYLADPRFLYQPYWARSGDHRVAMLFRDHYISDRIGFAYQGMTGRQAAEDLMFRLACIHEAVKDDLQPSVVPIILDGENAWEHYEQNGETFLRALYEKLSSEPWIRAVTVSEYLNDFPPRAEIPRLATGSWINGNLETWIGEESQNTAWGYLYRAREALAQAETAGASRDDLSAAYDEMLAAEGSDWFWWYYSHNVSDQDALFDELFRQHLAGVFRALGQPVPEWVSIPITAATAKLGSRRARGYVHLPAERSDLSPVAWDQAGYLEPVGSTGAMQQGSNPLKRLYFGYDEAFLRLRIEAHSSLAGYAVGIYMTPLGPAAGESDENGNLEAPVRPLEQAATREIDVAGDGVTAALSKWQEDTGWVKYPAELRVTAGETVREISVPLDALATGLGNAIGLSLVLFKEGLVVQRLPEEGEIVVDLKPVSETASVSA
ncbi:MAG TPA: glycoside hydrolase family 57 protein [Chloroflexota bacterium]